MSVEMVFYVDGFDSARTLADFWALTRPGSQTYEADGMRCVVRMDGDVYATSFEPTEAQRIRSLEEFGIGSKVAVVFRLDIHRLADGLKAVLQACREAIDHVSGDCVLLHNWEKIVFRRVSGELVINRGFSQFVTVAAQLPPHASMTQLD